jgi:hypothetical protein
MKDIDSVSADLTRELAFSPLEKMLPPKLRYRFYKWLKQYSAPRINPMQGVHKTVDQAFAHMLAIKELKKNEVMTSVFEDGSVRFDFGGAIDPKIKKSAMDWAKRKGLKASEASLDKSAGSASYVVYANGTPSMGVCVKFSKVSV